MSAPERAIDTRAVVISIYAFMGVELLQGAISFVQAARGGGGSSFETPIDVADTATAGLQALVFVVSGFLILRWIYRANKRAHQLSPGRVRTSPGWNVGWFFIPIANLWKPFEGVRQTYQASVRPEAPEGVETPGVLRGWWGVWIVSNILSNLAVRLQSGATLAVSQVIYGVAGLLALPLGLLLIRVIRLITQAQRAHADTSVFS